MRAAGPSEASQMMNDSIFSAVLLVPRDYSEPSVAQDLRIRLAISDAERAVRQSVGYIALKRREVPEIGGSEQAKNHSGLRGRSPKANVQVDGGYFALRVERLSILPAEFMTPTVVPCVTFKAASVAALFAPAM